MFDKQAMQHTMGMIKKIDSVPKDEILLVYTKEQPTVAYYEQLKKSLENIRESMDINMFLMPSEDIEVTTLVKYLKRLPAHHRAHIVASLTEGDAGDE